MGAALLWLGVCADPVLAWDQGEDEPKTLVGASVGAGVKVWDAALDIAAEAGQYTVDYDQGSDHVQRPLRLRVGLAKSF